MTVREVYTYGAFYRVTGEGYGPEGEIEDEAGDLLFPNAERHLRPLDEIATLFARAPRLIKRTGEIADRCEFSLDQLRYEYPRELVPPGFTPAAWLRQLSEQGLAALLARSPSTTPTQPIHSMSSLAQDRQSHSVVTPAVHRSM